MKTILRPFGLLAFLFILAGHASLRAETVTLIPVADASIGQGTNSAPEPNNGQSSQMIIGTQGLAGASTTNRGLIRFDVAGKIPAAATITSVTLSLTVDRAPSNTNSIFALHRMLREWNETAVTWTVRLGSAEPWGSPGGGEGIDFLPAVSAAKLVDSIGLYTFDSTPNLVADVSSWVKGTAPDFGWMVRTTVETNLTSARRVAARENPVTPPVLVVQYTLPPPPLRITSVGVLGNDLCLTFPARVGKRYVVDRRPGLDSGDWSVLTNISTRTVNMEVIVCDPLGVENQFYRVSEF